MRNKILALMVITVLLAGCAVPQNPSQGTIPATQAVKTESVSTGSADLTPASPTPTQEPTPSSTPEPVAVNFNAQNFSKFTGIQNYAKAISKHFEREASDLPLLTSIYSPDGSTIAVAGCFVDCATAQSGNYFLIVLDAKQQTPIQDIPIDNTKRVQDIRFTHDAGSLIYSIRGQVMLHDLKTNKSSVFLTLENSEEIPYIDVSPDGKLLAVTAEKQISIFDLQTRKSITQIPGEFWGQNSPFFNTSGNRLAIYSKESDREVILFDTTTWREVARFPVSGTGKAGISPDGNRVAILSADDLDLKVINVSTNKTDNIPVYAYEVVTWVTFNPAGDLILAFGSPKNDIDSYEGVQVINVKLGTVVGSLTQETNPGRILFSADGTSFLRPCFTIVYLEKWALPSAEILKADTLIHDYFDAISRKDYQKAAAMTQLDKYSKEDLVNRGLNPDDLQAVFAVLCVEDEVPCLPLGRLVRIVADTGESWDYSAIVTLKKPDGTEVMFDGITPYAMVFIIVDNNGQLKISSIHPGMGYPYPQ